MKRLTYQPDDHMKWIYDPRFKDYPQAIDLRKRREAAIQACPQWMRGEAARNDEATQNSHTDSMATAGKDASA